MVSSPNSRRKRSLDSDDAYNRKTRRESEDGEALLKLLVPDYVAGALIGKGGACLTEIKNTFGGYLRISGGREYYPGTEERVVVITGEESEVSKICNHIMEKVEDPGRDSSMRQVEVDRARAKRVKIVLTDSASGRIIGRGGETIKAIQEESKAKLAISMAEKSAYPGERILTIDGSFNERKEACELVIEKLATDRTNAENIMTKYPPSGSVSSTRGYGAEGGLNHHSYQSTRPMSISASSEPRKVIRSRVTVEMEIPDSLVGSILGKQGCVVKEMVQKSGGARFKFADEKADDTDDRKLTITGNMDQCKMAHMLLNERLAEIEHQTGDFSRYVS